MALPEDADGRTALAPPWLGPAIRDTIEIPPHPPPHVVRACPPLSYSFLCASRDASGRSAPGRLSFRRGGRWSRPEAPPLRARARGEGHPMIDAPNRPQSQPALETAATPEPRRPASPRARPRSPPPRPAGRCGPADRQLCDSAERLPTNGVDGFPSSTNPLASVRTSPALRRNTRANRAWRSSGGGARRSRPAWSWPISPSRPSTFSTSSGNPTPRDASWPTTSCALPSPRPRRTLAPSSRTDYVREIERHAIRAHPCRQPAAGPAGSASCSASSPCSSSRCWRRRAWRRRRRFGSPR